MGDSISTVGSTDSCVSCSSSDCASCGGDFKDAGSKVIQVQAEVPQLKGERSISEASKVISATYSGGDCGYCGGDFKDAGSKVIQAQAEAPQLKKGDEGARPVVRSVADLRTLGASHAAPGSRRG